MNETAPVRPWQHLLTPEDHITNLHTYDSSPYLPLFSEETFLCRDERIRSLRYFLFDPTEHGFSKEKKYPLIYSLHGAGAALHGREAIDWAGVAMYASPKYQEEIGGAYILCPLANEYEDKDGKLQMPWMTPEKLSLYDPETLAGLNSYYNDYTRFFTLLGTDSVYAASLYELLHSVLKEYEGKIGKNLLFGTSSGGYGAWRLLINHPEDYSFALIMAGAYLPGIRELEKITASDCDVMICQSKNDEIVPYGLVTAPNLAYYEAHPEKYTLYLPDLVRAGDHGVASNMKYKEMGQHCINDAVQQNLVYDDGTPYDKRFPEGITGILRHYQE